ncbi:PREDICTED: proline-rich proteoglycan 2-like, partial [Fulmarus glacialis]|uniref:proline-rich proteoglycan 2-like n=1 Tax=Fulmarus glacialis TaxID=30455 RepID=UPI00051C93A3
MGPSSSVEPPSPNGPPSPARSSSPLGPPSLLGQRSSPGPPSPRGQRPPTVPPSPLEPLSPVGGPDLALDELDVTELALAAGLLGTSGTPTGDSSEDEDG